MTQPYEPAEIDPESEEYRRGLAGKQSDPHEMAARIVSSAPPWRRRAPWWRTNIKTIGIVAGVGLLALLLIAVLVLRGADLRDPSPLSAYTLTPVQPDALGTMAALSVSLPIMVTPSAVIVVTPTPEPSVVQSLQYTKALSYSLQGRWQEAAVLLRDIYSREPGYLETAAELRKVYYQWGLADLQAENLPAALEKFNTALVIVPLDQDVLKEQRQLGLYLGGVEASDRQQWDESIRQFEHLHDTFGEYRDTTLLLYTAYFEHASELEQQNELQAAADFYRKAQALVNDDPRQAAERAVAVDEKLKQQIAAEQTWTIGGRVVEAPTDDAVRCGSVYESKIWGVVRNANGRGIDGAIVQVQSRDGRNKFRARTNSQGGFEVPGLGCTTWLVYVVSAPGAPQGTKFATLTVRLNGGRYSGAGVEFQLRRS